MVHFSKNANTIANNFNLAQLVMCRREPRTRHALITSTFHFYDHRLINNES